MSTADPVSRPTAAASRVRFSEFEVDLRARELYRDGESVPLQGRPFEVLVALLERPGEVVLRQELRERLWPGQIVEFDNNLNTAVTKLRRALEDTRDDPTLIETLPRRGYRLLVPVEWPSEDPLEASAVAPNGVRRNPWRSWLWLLAALVVVAVAFVAGTIRRPAPDMAASERAAASVPARTARLVVLPFAALDGTDASERLAATFTDELITRLAELLPAEVGVIARTSATRFGGAAGVAEIRRALDVDYLLEGSVAGDANGLEVRARFIHAADQAHLWAERHDSPLGELPRIQRALAERIAATTSVHLRTAGVFDSGRAVPPEAWEAYLQARFVLSAGPAPTDHAVAAAVADLERAVERAPDFALAWAALADAVYRQRGPAPARHERARAAAERALDLDPTLALAHHRLASLALYQRWDWAEAEREFDWALSLAPGLALTHHSRAAWFSTQGRHDEALASIERALALDPLSVVLHADAGWYLFVARRYEEAVARCRQALELVPEHRGANSYLFHSLLKLGRTDEAAAVARTLLAIEGAGADERQRAASSSAAAIETLHRYRLAVLEADAERGLASPSRLALAHLALGDHERALDFLELGFEQRWGWLYPFLAVYPLLDPLTEEPRFRALVAAVGSPAERSASR